MTRSGACLKFCLLLICSALPTQAAANTACSYYFTTGSGNTYMYYCVTANGIIPFIYTPFDHLQIGQTLGDREGYGICNESPAAEYHDYGTEDSGNWNAASLVSQGSTFVKIARNTSDGNWTLTQTITIVPSRSSIKIVMALTNNQAVSKVAYLVRYAYVNADGYQGNIFGATLNSAFAWDANVTAASEHYGLQLQNVGTPQFGYWHAFAQTVSSGPNACAFAFNDSGGYFLGNGSVVIAYVGTVPAHGTKTATMTYRGL